MPLYIVQSGDLGRCHACVTDGRTDGQTLKDKATQLLIKYKSGALVTHICRICPKSPDKSFYVDFT